MLTIVADQNMSGVAQAFGALGRVVLVDGRRLSPADIASADALLVRSVTRVDKELLAGSPVRFVGSATSGVDHIDQPYLAGAGINFAHAPGANANAVVEYVLTAIASCGDQLEQLLAGACVGIVGYGHVGRLLAVRLAALGILHRIYDPWLDPSSVSHQATLADVMAADVVSLHPELTRRKPWPSYHLLAAPALARLGPRRLLLNASRGAVIDNRALIEVLQTGNGPSVVLDVWEYEPTILAPLLALVQFGTPHIAGYSLDGKLLATKTLGRALLAALDLHSGDIELTPPTLPPLRPPADLSRPDLLRWLLNARYQLRRDDASLRQATLGKSSHRAATGFDALRKSYPERRELRGSEVLLGDYPEATQELVAALGCLPRA